MPLFDHSSSDDNDALLLSLIIDLHQRNQSINEDINPCLLFICNKFKPSEFKSSVSNKFFGKFRNGSISSDIKLGVPVSSSDYVNIAILSEKNSGSLINWDGNVFTKNGNMAMYTRSFYIVLEAHFKVTWGDQWQIKIAELKEFLVEYKMSLSFELIVPRLLGDHASEPNAAVITLITGGYIDKDGNNKFLNELELINIATKWKLNLPKIYVCNAKNINPISKGLDELRWVCDATQPGQFIEQVINSNLEPGEEKPVHINSLPYSEWHDLVLEGYVIKVIQVPISFILELNNSIKEYNTVFTPLIDQLLLELGKLGDLFRIKDPELLAKLEMPCGNVQLVNPSTGEKFIPEESTYLDIPKDVIWRFAELHASKHDKELLNILEMYESKISLKMYKGIEEYKGHINHIIQIVVHVHDDEVFYMMTDTHEKFTNCTRLFRGMVFRFGIEDENKKVFDSAYDVITEKIIKFKFLNYIWRTMSVRNLLQILHRDGKEAYMQRAFNKFCKNWNVPTQYHNDLYKLFNYVADKFKELPDSEQAIYAKNSGTYLDFLSTIFKTTDPNLRGVAKFISGFKFDIDSYQQSITTDIPDDLPLVIVHDLPEITPHLIQLGFKETDTKSLRGVVIGGFVNTKYPITLPKGLDRNNVIILTSGAMNKCVSSKYSDLPITVDPRLEDLQSILRPLKVHKEPSVIVNSIGFAAMPPGFGKSYQTATLEKLAKMTKNTQVCVYSSDKCTENKQNHAAEIVKILRTTIEIARSEEKKTGEKQDILFLIDKNIPDFTGLESFIKMLKYELPDVIFKFTLFVPLHIDEDVSIKRITGRTNHILKKNDPTFNQIFYKFLNSCKKWLSHFQALDCAIKIDMLSDKKSLFDSLTIPNIIRCSMPLLDLNEIIIDKLRGCNSEKPISVESKNPISLEASDDAKPHNISVTKQSYLVAKYKNDLHITLIPPSQKDSDGQPLDNDDNTRRLDHLRKIVPYLNGRIVSCSIIGYVCCFNTETGARICYFDVADVNLDEADKYFPQKEGYHITDNLSIIKAAPSLAFTMKMHIKNQTVPPEWTIKYQLYDRPVEIQTTIQIK